MKKLHKRWRRRRFIKAYGILRDEANRHKEAHHLMEFVAVNESYILMRCTACPDLQPITK